MLKHQNKAVFWIILILIQAMKVQSGPIACSTCLTAVGSVFSGTGTAVGGCFALGIPQLICGCLAGLGTVVGIGGIIICTTVCFLPTPWFMKYPLSQSLLHFHILNPKNKDES